MTDAAMTRLGTAEEQAARAAGIELPKPPVLKPRLTPAGPESVGDIEVTFNEHDGQYRVRATKDGATFRLACQHGGIAETARHCWAVVCERTGTYGSVPKFEIPKKRRARSRAET